MHVETTGCAGPGSSAHAPNLREANCINMFNNRIGFGPRLGAVILDLIFIMLLIVPISLLGLGSKVNPTRDHFESMNTITIIDFRCVT